MQPFRRQLIVRHYLRWWWLTVGLIISTGLVIFARLVISAGIVISAGSVISAGLIIHRLISYGKILAKLKLARPNIVGRESNMLLPLQKQSNSCSTIYEKCTQLKKEIWVWISSVADLIHMFRAVNCVNVSFQTWIRSTIITTESHHCPKYPYQTWSVIQTWFSKDSYQIWYIHVDFWLCTMKYDIN